MQTTLTMERLSKSISAAWFGTPPVDWPRWTTLTLVAVAGSLLYGASLSLVLPGWTATSAALWLAISAGLSWCVLIPVLCLVLRVPLIPCIDACLVTMAWGEAVLALGVLINLALWSRGAVMHAAWMNLALVGVSNVVMALVLVNRLRSRSASPARVWTAWMLALNGSGAAFFLLFHHWLHPS
jgi:hypothetical protein